MASPGTLAFLRLRSGRPDVYPTPEEAAEYRYTPFEREMAKDRMSSQFVGDPATVRQGLEQLVEQTGADELMISTMVHGQADRLESYRLRRPRVLARQHLTVGAPGPRGRYDRGS